MASLLYRLGRFSFRRRRLTAGLWMLLLIALTFGSAGLSGPTNDALSIPGTESWRALDVVAEKFGTGTATAEAKVVFTVPGAGTLADPERRTAVRAAVAELRKAPQVTEVDDPYDTKKIAPDGRTGYASVSYRVPETEVTEASRAALLAVGDSARRAGLGVEFSGDVIEEEESSSSAEGIGLLVAAVILMITFGSLVAAGLPVLTAVLGVAAGVLGISIATGFLELTSNTSALALMLGLAVGIDYALFILSRYRDELAAGHDGEEAAGRAVGTAGSAVVFAGLTVIIALIALTVVGIPFLAAMGIAAAGTVAIAVVISLSLLPALIGFAGSTVRPKARRATARTPFGERWARLVVRHRVPVMILAVAAAGVAALPALGLKLALPDAGSAPAASTQRKGYDQLAAAFGAGINGPWSSWSRRPPVAPRRPVTRRRGSSPASTASSWQPRRRPTGRTTRRPSPSSLEAAPPARTPRISCTASGHTRRASPPPTAVPRCPSPAGPPSTSTCPRRSPTRCCRTWPSWSAWRSCCSCWSSAASWCRSRPRSGSCCRWSPRSAPWCSSSSRVTSPARSAWSPPVRSSASSRSSWSASCSASPWTTRSSWSPAPARSSCGAPLRTTPSSPACGTARGSSPPRP
ncbi:hypothetical protein Asp14428_18180 [Actinoplanes sp. NBRC 14428]|nr:hypothetical protein Asp14428_18180 [Actinoplanes sp. NBRC 14428]